MLHDPRRIDRALAPNRRAEVGIVLAEAQANMRNLLTHALVAQRFTQIEPASSLAEVVEICERSAPDVIVLDGDLPGSEHDAQDLIRDLRQARIGLNPFVAILLTLWRPDVETVRRAGLSGADAILVKPIAPAALVDRIAALSLTRKRYVSTTDYVGPDRRRERARIAVDAMVEVPNTLALKARGAYDEEALVAALIAADEDMRRLRIKRQTLRLAALAHIAGDDPSDALARTLERVADDLARGLPRAGGPEGQLAETLLQVARAIALRRKEKRAKAVTLLSPLIEALLLAVHPDRSRLDLAAEIADLAQGEAVRLAVQSIRIEENRLAQAVPVSAPAA